MLSWICPADLLDWHFGELAEDAIAGVIDQNIHRDIFAL